MAKVQADLPELWDDPQVLRGPVVSLEPVGTLWTIGHSTHPIGEFIAILQAHGITCLADVRSFPGSRRYPQFNADALAVSLPAAGITYTPMRELGGRRRALPDSPHVAWHNSAFRGYADYMDTPAFAAGALELAALAREHRVAMMCSEAVWWRCHRSMISDYFKAHGWTVLHIMGTEEATEHPYTPVARILDGQLAY